MKRTALDYFSVYSYYDKVYPIKISKISQTLYAPIFRTEYWANLQFF